MTVALDATYSVGANLSGVGVYSRELLSGVTAAHPEAAFRFCYRPHRLLRSLAERLPSNAGRSLLTETYTPSADIFHGLNQRLPHARLRRSVCTFHDLFVLTGDYSTPEFRHRFASQARDAAERANRIIAVSQFTANQVADLLRIPPARIQVVHHGVRPCSLSPAPRPVILHVGAIQVRKNITRLVEAFERVEASWQLVLAGSAGFGAPGIMERIASSPSRERIQVLGYVPACELVEWYRRAAIFAFPSLDEGFGMPVLEAMAAGVPVLASNRAALPEVAGNAAWLVDAENTEELTGALVELTRSPERRAELARLGPLRAAQFTWKDAIESTWRIYCDLLS